MVNQIVGIITVALCFIGYFFSWNYNSKGNHRLALLLLILCGLALRIYTSTDLFLHPWDERYHALVAKNLIQHMLTPTLYDNPIMPYDMKSWISSHIWLHKQPLPLWTMAGSMWVFGVNEIALRLPSIILTTIGIYLTFYIANYFFNKKTAFIASFLYSINGLIIEMTGGRIATDHIDVFFLFFIELAVFFTLLFAEKRKTIYTVLAGISMGAAILCKWLPALIVIAIWLLVLLETKSFNYKTIIFHLMIICFASVIVFLPWQLYIHQAFPEEAKWESSFNLKHITEILDEQGGPFYYYIDKIRINYGELIYLPLIWFLWITFSGKLNLKFSALTVWIVVPVFFFSFVMTKMQGYILFVSPALFMITAEFWYFLAHNRENSKYKWLKTIIMVLLIALPVRYCIERMKPFERSERSPQWVKDLKTLEKKNITNGVMFNYEQPIEAMFYTNLTVYDDLPDKHVIMDLKQKGYTIVINDNERVSADIHQIEGLQFEHLAQKTEK